MVGYKYTVVNYVSISLLPYLAQRFLCTMSGHPTHSGISERLNRILLQLI